MVPPRPSRDFHTRSIDLPDCQRLSSRRLKHFSIIPFLLAGTLCLAASVSCRENPEASAERRRQAQKITELEERLRKVRAEMAEPVTETAVDLRKSREAAEAAEQLVKQREQELATAEADLDKATREDGDYRRKYVVEGQKGDKP